jgi:hypothetical protein
MSQYQYYEFLAVDRQLEGKVGCDGFHSIAGV